MIGWIWVTLSWATPAVGDCVDADNALHAPESCGGFCTYDPVLSTLVCDASTACGDARAKGWLTDTFKDASPDRFVASVECGPVKACCSVFDDTEEITRLELWGTDSADILGLSYCDGAMWDLSIAYYPVCPASQETLSGTLTADIHAGKGRDIVIGADRAEVGGVLMGDDGNDDMWGLAGDDHMYGGPGRDRIYGGPGEDHLFGEAGSDELYGYTEDDYLDGGPGNDDKVEGGDGNDTLFGGAGRDVLTGYAGEDFLYGGTGADTLEGGTEDDILCDAIDGDTLKGQEGSDLVYYLTAGGLPPDAGTGGSTSAGTTGSDDDHCSESVDAVPGSDCEHVYPDAWMPPDCMP
jgi:hypothetical protein